MTSEISSGVKKSFDVTLVGDANLDLLLYGLPDELPPEQELLAEGMAIRLGGSGAITAHNLAALGSSVGLIATAVDDDLGKLCRRELSAAGVDLSRCVVPANAQTGATVLLQHALRRHMFTYAGATFDLKLSDLDLGYLTSARHFHMSSYYLQRALTPEIPKLFEQLKSAGLTISLDTNDDPEQKWGSGLEDALRLVDVLLPNEREACLMTGETDLDTAIERLRQKVPLLVIKQGQKGAAAFTSGGSYFAEPPEVEFVDAVGAGDSFNAGFLHAWQRGWSLEEALAFGNLTGAWSTTASGGTTAFRNEASLAALWASWDALVATRLR